MHLLIAQRSETAAQIECAVERSYHARVRIWPACLVVTGCFSAPTRPSDTADAPTIAGGFRRTITIVQPPAAELESFPVSVLIENDTSLRDKSKGPAHIAFTTTDGTALPCEIVQVSPSGTLEAWVKLPTLPATVSTFELAYGPEILSPCEVKSVWTDYLGAWHLSEAAPGSARDSSSHGHTLIGRDGGLPDPMPGMVGMGLRFDPAATVGDELCIENAPALQLDLQPFSYELWVIQEQYIGMYDIALTKGGSSNGKAGFDMELGNAEWNAYLRDNADPENRVSFANDSSLLVNKWHHLAVTVDRDAGFIRSYRDGLELESEPIMIDSVSGTSAFCLGNRYEPMRGLIDEARVHAQARTREWFVTSYANVVQRDLFMTVGPEH
jgi:hypothetical protein